MVMKTLGSGVAPNMNIVSTISSVITTFYGLLL